VNVFLADDLLGDDAMRIINRLRWVADTVSDRAWLLRTMHIDADALVLDVGAGASPNLRSNVLCEKFVSDSLERGGQPVRHDRPLVVGDAQRLPFKDKAFDFVICSHLLEHVDDPTAAIAELQRVASRGYIETPAANWEKVSGFPFHRWTVALDEGVLVFRRKPAPLWDTSLQKWFTNFTRSLNVDDKAWFARRRLGLTISLMWEGAISFRVEGRSDDQWSDVAKVDDFTEETPAQLGGGLAARALERYGRIIRRRSEVTLDQIRDRLACPSCKGALSWQTETVDCTACSAAYPIDAAGRPWLIREAEITTEIRSRSGL
jgi:SAM-dependent methyltransferase/uncharacterized protein YbaR (Trm112 family)